MKDHTAGRAGYFEPETCSLEEFIRLTDRQTDPGSVPNAAEIAANVPVYDVPALGTVLSDPAKRRDLMAEWARVLLSGAGAVALRGAYSDTTAIDEATVIYEKIIAQEKCAEAGGGDHFAASGANDRIWNALQKLCEASPDVFLRYFGNDAISAVCEAWLGPNYQMTAQVNLVHPGGAAQQAHRDYHLGFQSAELSAAYPAHVHAVSPVLTLQGAVAHCDMPLESGPTRLLPFSQTYLPGYAAWRRPDFRDYFAENFIQLPLLKGDCVFFNPALFHAAGDNSSADIHRMANLLQVSSAFGRAMESVDRLRMSSLLYPVALAAVTGSTMPAADLRAAVAACAEGYPFPTNLDLDPPAGGLAPESQQAFVLRALEDRMPVAQFNKALEQQNGKRRP